MPIILLKVFRFLGSSDLVKKLVFYAFLMMIGFAGGNYHATQRALNEQLADAAIHEAKVEGDLFKAYKGKITDLKVHVAEDKAKDQTAGTHAATFVAAAKTAADRDHDAAIAQIAKEKPKEIVNASLSCPPVVPFSFSPDTRRLLDTAAGATPSGIRPSDGGASPADPGGRFAPTTAASAVPARR